MLIDANVTEKVIACAIQVHSRLGPGLLESLYESALCIELRRAGFNPHRQVTLPVLYRGVAIGSFRADLIVDEKVLSK